MAPNAETLGIDGTTVLAIRPDRNVGYRGDGGGPEGLRAYLAELSA